MNAGLGIYKAILPTSEIRLYSCLIFKQQLITKEFRLEGIKGNRIIMRCQRNRCIKRVKHLIQTTFWYRKSNHHHQSAYQQLQVAQPTTLLDEYTIYEQVRFPCLIFCNCHFSWLICERDWDAKRLAKEVYTCWAVFDRLEEIENSIECFPLGWQLYL